MRVWFVNHYALPPGATGGPTRHLGLARALCDRGHEVTIVASVFDHYSRTDHRRRRGRRPIMEDIDGVTYVWIPTPPYGSTVQRLRNMATFTARVARAGAALPLSDPDLVVGSSPHLLAPLAAQWIAKRRSARFFMEVRDIWPQSLIDLGELSPRHPAIVGLRLIESHLYRTSDELITVLPAAHDHYTDHGARPEHIHVLPNGVALDGVEAPRRREHDGFVAVYTGTMGLANGLDVVVDAAAVLRARGRGDISIRLVGSGPEHESLARRATSLPNITVEDAVSSTEVPEILASADVGLLTLLDSPVFRWGISPTKLFDYMAAGLPVVVSVRTPTDPASAAKASIRVEPGDPVELADALISMADLSSEEREAMGRRARVAVESHDFTQLAEAFERIVEQPGHGERRPQAGAG